MYIQKKDGWIGAVNVKLSAFYSPRAHWTACFASLQNYEPIMIFFEMTQNKVGFSTSTFSRSAMVSWVAFFQSSPRLFSTPLSWSFGKWLIVKSCLPQILGLQIATRQPRSCWFIFVAGHWARITKLWLQTSQRTFATKHWAHQPHLDCWWGSRR